MTRCVIVIPSIVPSVTADCLASLHPDIIHPDDIPRAPFGWQREPTVHVVNGATWTDGTPDVRLVVVWNTPEKNLGVAGSWNVGVDEVLRTGADWLVVLSAAVRFGDAGGRDFLGALGSPEYEWARVVEADSGLGWHAIAFSLGVLDLVGRFDPIFHPAYFEDNDWSVRFQRAYGRDTHAPDFLGPLWPKVPVDARLMEVAHAIKRGGVEVDMEGLRQKLIAKWGPNEEYATPYNDPELDWTFVGPYRP